MKRFKFVVVLGGNWREYPPKNASKDWQIRGSVETKMRALAAGEFYRRGLAEKIIFSGGQTAGKNYPSEAEAMWRYLHVKFPEIVRKSVILEENSIDTEGNTENVARMLDGVKGDIALITTAYHLPRAMKVFGEYGILAKGFAAEEVLQGRSAYWRRFVSKFQISWHVRWEKTKEKIARLMPKKILRQITKRIRHQDS